MHTQTYLISSEIYSLTETYFRVSLRRTPGNSVQKSPIGYCLFRGKNRISNFAFVRSYAGSRVQWTNNNHLGIVKVLNNKNGYQ